VQIGPIHNATITNANLFDLVLCTDVLEHIPIRDIPDTLSKISELTKPGGSVFLVIASDPSKHENHPERSSAAIELKQSGMKIHETLKPRSWWLHELLKYDLEEDEQAFRVFLKTNQEEVHGPRYGYSISNFKNRGHTKFIFIHRTKTRRSCLLPEKDELGQFFVVLLFSVKEKTTTNHNRKRTHLHFTTT